MRSNVALPLGLSLAIAAALAASPLSAQPVTASTTTATAIAQGTPLPQALADLARGAKLQLVYQAKVTNGLVAPAVPAGIPVDQALRRLLQGSGLDYSFLNPHTVVISAPKVPAAASKPAAGSSATDLQQVTVTASKRVQPLQEIPGGISAVSGTELKEIGAQSNADYLGRLPGVVFNAGIPGQSTAVIRGVGTTAGIDQGQGPTGWYIDDVPLSEPSYAVGIPDIDTFDLQRVEVLRGPQGTLFGSASLGGAINYITNPADTSGFDAAFEAGLSSTQHADGDLGYTVKGMINLPLVDERLALRAVVLKREDAGYLDNTGTGKKGSTDVATTGGRVSLVWTPDEATRVSLMGLYQKSVTDDQNYAHSAQGKYARYTLFPAKADYDISLFTGRLEHSLAFGELTAILSQSKKTHELHSDVTATSAVRPLLPAEAQIDSTESMDITMKTAEVRLASTASDRFEWLLGTMFSSSDRDTRTYTHADGAYAILSALRPTAEYDGSDNFNRTYSVADGEEYAFFGEGNLHFNDAWTLTAGGRFFKSRYNVTLDRYGYSYVPSQHPGIFRISETGFVPKASLLYSPSRDFTTYATVSKGFRVGNPNTIYPCECDFDTPAGWDSDSLWNYELGLRSDFLDRRGHVDAAVFYVDWSDLQVRLTRPDNVTYGTNAGAARIYGLEGNVSFDLTADLSWNTSLTLLNAELTEDVLNASPALHKGQKLPGASDVQIANTLTWRLPTALDPTLILSHRYLSDAPETLSDKVARVGGYNQIDLRLNLRHKQWDYSVWGTNLNNAYAATFGYGTSSYAIYGRSEFIIRPRTFGVSAAWHFN